MEVVFTANQNHCSDIIAHIVVDGREYVSTKVGPGQRDGGHVFQIKAGPHVVGVQAEVSEAVATLPAHCLPGAATFTSKRSMTASASPPSFTSNE
jgi:hypothetical protein